MCIFCKVNEDCTVLYGYDIVALFPARRNYHYEMALIKQTTLRHSDSKFGKQFPIQDFSPALTTFEQPEAESIE